MAKKKAIIIGAGPAGLTAALELLKKTDIQPIIFEMSLELGGISKTVNYKGNRIDIGGHRFFSKSYRVMRWWLDILPLQNISAEDKKKSLFLAPYLSEQASELEPEKVDKIMLVRKRFSRIFFSRELFDYPLSFNRNMFGYLGIKRILRILLSYIKIRLFPIKKEKSLEDFFINRFGKELYLIFFRDYTKKVWGLSCDQISSDWGAQRVKGISITKTITHFIKKKIPMKRTLGGRYMETSLIEYFLYPKFGPGQMWETVRDIIKERGGEIYLNHRAIGLRCEGKRVVGVATTDDLNGGLKYTEADYFFSIMPVKDLIKGISGVNLPREVSEVASGLLYRDFITVGLLVKKLKKKNDTEQKTFNDLIPDNWIYVQEEDINMGRIQIFNNWSPYMVKDKNNVWLGLEYFCNEGDQLWNKTDAEMADFAITELATMGFIYKEDVIDFVVIHVPKTYPVYSGTYAQFGVIRKFLDEFENLFLIGRNGMHRYNNMDHSMLTAMVAVDNLSNGIKSKDNIWNVNTERYHGEEIKTPTV